MSLATACEELKKLVATYDTRWLLGDLSSLMRFAGGQQAQDQLGELSSPLRQFYFLAGLLVSSDPTSGTDLRYTPEKWQQMVRLLNEIEQQYDQLYQPKDEEAITEQWMKIRQVAMPSFMAYFNQGPLNYEEQELWWLNRLYPSFDELIVAEIGLTVADFDAFYQQLDELMQQNFQSYMSPRAPVRPDWRTYTKMVMRSTAPPALQAFLTPKKEALFHFMADKGIATRFFPVELVSAALPLAKVEKLLALLATTRQATDFLYYASTKPANPLLARPIVDLGDGLYQVFEIKQVLHAITAVLDRLCTSTNTAKRRYVSRKGKLLEDKLVVLFESFFPSCKIFRSYYVDGNEQDILVLWEDCAFIVEAKGYNLREPLRDPDRAFVRIQDDFDACLGYGYAQTRRVEQKFIEGVPLRLTDEHGNLRAEIDTRQYAHDFSIIVNLHSFGQVQCDLSALLKLGNDDVFPWAIRLDDLEVFLLTLLAQKKTPRDFVDFLLFREELHGKLTCLDELAICGGFLSGQLTAKSTRQQKHVTAHPDLADVFDEQYQKGLGFENEKLLVEKRSGNYLFM